MPRSKVGDMMKSKTFDVFYQSIVQNIKRKQVDKNANQNKLAEVLHTYQSAVSKKLKGEKSQFTIEDLFNLSLFFKCSVEDLVANKEKAPDYRK